MIGIEGSCLQQGEAHCLPQCFEGRSIPGKGLALITRQMSAKFVYPVRIRIERASYLLVGQALTVLLLILTVADSSVYGLDGQVLYLRHCANCHGLTGRGDGPDADAFPEKPRDLREGLLEKYSTDDLVRRIREGVPLRLELDLPRLKEQAKEVMSLAAHVRRLPDIDWSLAYEGWDLYTYRCTPCHGLYGAPPATLPPGVRAPRDLSDPAFQESISDAHLLKAVRHGRRGMPALLPRLPESAGASVAAFVRLLSPGFRTYTLYCAGCHGDDGLGADDAPGESKKPAVKLDRAFLARTSEQKLYDAIWHMVRQQKAIMPHFEWTISDAEVRAILEYLKKSEP